MDKRAIKIFLAVMLFLCLLKMPYGYYQLVRIAGTLGFAYLAYIEYKEKVNVFPILWGIMALLMNPVFKFAFRRTEWNWIDGIAGAVLLFSLLKNRRKQKTPGIELQARVQNIRHCLPPHQVSIRFAIP